MKTELLRALTRQSPHRWALMAVLAVALGVTFSSCDSFLETEPKGELTSANYFQNAEQAVQGTNATYAHLRSWQVHVFSWLGMTEIVSDDADKGSAPNDASFLRELDQLNFDPGNNAFLGTWSGYYTGVFRANLAIQSIPSIDMDEELKSRLLGENKFLRAYYYFFLVRAFGGVPLITEPLRPSEFEQERASREEVYALIEQDLLDAIEALPERSGYSSGDLGRVTKGAARTLLAKAHLYQEEFQEAQQYAEAVINSGEYSLYPDYGYVFSQAGEYSSGSIFEIGQVALEQGDGAGQYSQVQGVRGTPNLGWGFNQPSDDLELAYEPGDPRQQVTILYPWELLSDGSNQVVYINMGSTSQQYNQKVQVPSDNPGGSGNTPVNIRRFRYADLLLVAAEAAYRNGDESAARNYLNQVRERARSGQGATVGIIPDQLADYIATENLGLDEGGVFVRYLNEGGSAADSRLQALESSFFVDSTASTPSLFETIDMIETVNGTEVSTVDEYRSAVGAVSPGATVTLGVQRFTQQATGEGMVETASESFEVELETSALLPDVTASGDALLRAIWDERRVELGMEQHRWFDLIRQGRAEEAMRDLGLEFQPYMRLYPIPQSEIDQSGGLLEQNPGYPS